MTTIQSETRPAGATPDLSATSSVAVRRTSEPPQPVDPRGPAARLRDALRARRLSVAILTALLVLAGLAHGISMLDNPQVIDDEGTYVAQAYAVVQYGSLGHYTYWYDHPPLGWLQLAGYAQLTAGFERVDHAVDVGREFMLVVQLVSVALLWVLCRRLGLARWSTSVAVLVFALSPLAIQFHRTVFLDNIAVMWLLAALALAASPRRRLADLAGAAVCFAVAILTKETFLLLAPALGLLMWQGTDRSTRRYTIAVSAALFLAVGSAYLLLAGLKNELTPGAGQVSLAEGVSFQLFGRESGGSVFDPTSANRAAFNVWLNLDRVTLVVAALATPLALLARRLRPVAVGFVTLALTLLRPGYLPVPLVIAALPLAAVLIAGVADLAGRRYRSRMPAWSWLPGPVAAARPNVALVVVLTAVLAVTTPLWGTKLRGLWIADPNQPLVAAGTWLTENVSRDNRLMVDDAFWVDLVEAGFDRSNVVWAYKVDTDPAVQELSPRGWQDYDYVVVTESMRRSNSPGAQVSLALTNSVTVARFEFNGADDTRVEVRRIIDDTIAASPADIEAAQRRRVTAGGALAGNPAVASASAAETSLRGGNVDERLLTVLAGAAAQYSVRVADFPVVDGEQDVDAPRRVAMITEVDGVAVSSTSATSPLRQWLDEQNGLKVVATPTVNGLAISVPPGIPRSAEIPDPPADPTPQENS